MKRTTMLLLGGVLIGTGAFAALVHGDSARLFRNTAPQSGIAVGKRAIATGGPLDSKPVSRTVKRAQEAQSIPWSVDFQQTNLRDFTVIDANDDDCTWVHENGEAAAQYSPRNKMDDWLICPPLNFEGGKAYTLSFTAAANSTVYEEELEVYFGEEPTVEGMKELIIEPFTVSGVEFLKYTGVIVPRLDGKGYIGFHGISEPDRYKLRLSEISVTAGSRGEYPAGVANLEVQTGGPYDLDVTVSFAAPTTTMSGKALEEIEKIEIYRHTELVKSFGATAPGTKISFSDAVPSGGEYEYQVTAFNKAGAGYTMRHLVSIGGIQPMYPENVRLVELDQPGTMRLSWDPVTLDVEGNTIPEGFVSYVILDTEMNVIAENYKETSVEFYIPDIKEQQFIQCLVAAYTVGGLSEATMSNMRAIGPALRSFSESFRNGTLTSLMGTGYEFGYVDYIGWDVADDTTFTTEDGSVGISSYDGDNGFAYMQCEYTQTGSSLFTGKIALPEVGPAVNFAVFNQSQKNVPDENLLEIMVSEDGGDTWETISSKTVFEHCGSRQGWHYLTVGLQKYAGKTVMIRWQVSVVSYATFLIDAISVSSLPDWDLSIERISAADRVNAGEKMDIDVTVLNIGAKEVDEYTIHLLADGKRVKSYTLKNLAAGARQLLNIPYTVSPVAEGTLTFSAELETAKDANSSNDRSESVSVEIVAPRYPYVTDLKGYCAAEGMVTLSWSEPYVETYVPGSTEDFESGEDFAEEFGDWIFIDADRKPIGSLYPSVIPGVEPGESLRGFMVFNSEAPSFNSSMSAHSGKKYLASIFSYYNEEIDDWAITPELNGAAQVVSFWAKSLEYFYAETMELYYSFGSTDPKDFIFITKVDKVPGEWTEYNIPVPTGAKRFAVRNHSAGAMALLLDDFYFARAGEPVGAKVDHYNVYCDGELVGTVDGKERSFTHKGTNGNHLYAVTAYYEGLGESRGSNRVEIEVTNGDSSVGTVAARGEIRLEDRELIVEGFEGASLGIYTPDGKLIEFAERLGGSYRTALPGGVVIVRCGGASRKLIVR